MQRRAPCTLKTPVPLPVAVVAAWQAVLLGLLQGVTEWLPVSSSAHLLLAQSALGMEGDLVALDLWLHLGTLLALLLAFRARLARMAASAWRFLVPAGTQRPAWGADAERRLLAWLALASLPAALAGILAKARVEAAFGSPSFLGFFLAATGLVLLSTRLARPASRTLGDLRGTDAAAIGGLQAVALLPGLSRSGLSLAAGAWRGLSRESAVEASFLLAIPLLAGAALVESPRLFAFSASAGGLQAVAAGLAAAFLAGLATLRLLLRAVVRWGLAPFGLYCLALGLLLAWTAWP